MLLNYYKKVSTNHINTTMKSFTPLSTTALDSWWEHRTGDPNIENGAILSSTCLRWRLQRLATQSTPQLTGGHMRAHLSHAYWLSKVYCIDNSRRWFLQISSSYELLIVACSPRLPMWLYIRPIVSFTSRQVSHASHLIIHLQYPYLSTTNPAVNW